MAAAVVLSIAYDSRQAFRPCPPPPRRRRLPRSRLVLMGRLGSPWCGLPPEAVKEPQVGNVLNLLGWARDKLRERAMVVDEALAILCVELGAKGEAPWLEGSTFVSALAMDELRKVAVDSEWQVLPQPCAVLGVAAGQSPSNEQQRFIVTAATQESECPLNVNRN